MTYKLRNALIILSLVVVATTAFLFPLHKPLANISATPMTKIIWASNLEELARNLRSAIKDGRIAVEEFEKLDFTLPDDPGFGDNVAYEVFNPESPRQVVKGDTPILPLFNADDLDKITTVTGVQPFFNLRRHIVTKQHARGGAKSIAPITNDAIFAVIPDVNAAMCADANGWREVSLGQHTGAPMVFPPDVSTIVTDQDTRFHKCIQMQDGKTYFFHALAARVRSEPRPEWKPVTGITTLVKHID